MLRQRQPAVSPEVVARIRSLLQAPPPTGWVPAMDEEQVVADPPVTSTGGAVEPETEVKAPQPGTSPDRSPSALPRGSRFEVSRRAVAGLALIALMAAVLTGVAVLRGRPEVVPVAEVLRPGVPLPAGSPAAAAGGSAAGGPAVPGPAASGGPAGEVVVAVAGKVRRPGLVRLPAGSRVHDAVQAAGGVAAGSSTGLLNLARRLVDGEQVLVGIPVPAGPPGEATAGDTAGAPHAGPAGSSVAGQVPGAPLDLNAATASDLDGLPGIGPVLAERIVQWRTDNGRFASVDQLREVDGIGEAKFASLRSKVTV